MSTNIRVMKHTTTKGAGTLGMYARQIWCLNIIVLEFFRGEELAATYHVPVSHPIGEWFTKTLLGHKGMWFTTQIALRVIRALLAAK